MDMPAVGDLAPEVALPDETGTIHRLADQRGRWTILYFYPKDDTPGCTIEACEFRDSNDDDPRARRGRLGHQPAGRREPSARFREKFELPFTLLADEAHAVADAYGSWVEKQNYGRTYMGHSRGATFLVDPDGRIARVWPKVKPEGHAAEVLAALDELQAARVRDADDRTTRLRSWGETSEASAGTVLPALTAATVAATPQPAPPGRR